MIKLIDLQFKGIPKAVASFLLKTEEGPVLIETGPSSTLEVLIQEIEISGYHPEDVKHIFLTHIHLDHAGAAWWFAERGAKIYLHPKGLKHMEDPSRLINSAKMIYKDQMDALWGEIKSIHRDQLYAVENMDVVILGKTNFQALHTPGHAIHHISWRVDENLFTGDVAGIKIGDGPVMPPCPPPDIDLEAWNESIKIIINAPVKNIFLTHFGKINNKEKHLADLKEILNDWAQFIKLYWQKGVEVPEIVEKFQVYVHEQLQEKGMNDFGIQQYEAANPSWMSVQGLIRYWEKNVKND